MYNRMWAVNDDKERLQRMIVMTRDEHEGYTLMMQMVTVLVMTMIIFIISRIITFMVILQV